MSSIKKLAGQTAIYGLSTIVGRLLNYLLVPLLTHVFNPEQFGVITEFYAYISILIIILTYGTETTLFNYSRNSENKEKVYSTLLGSLLVSTLAFFALVLLFLSPISNALNYANNSNYVVYVAFIIGIDAFTALPFAKLREENKAFKFAFFKLINIGINIILTLYFLWICPVVIQNSDSFLFSFVNATYNASNGVAYVFIANLVASVVTLLLLLPSIFKINFVFDKQLWKTMIRYSYPLLLAGLAGMANETLDRILLKYLLPADIAMEQVGIYGACYKISILMTIFTQTYRYAAEPFFFSHAKNKNSKSLYAKTMLYFVIVCSVIFLGTMLNMQWIKYFVGKDFWVGLNVVPILLLANLFLGIFFNLSIWYKLAEKTRYGAVLTFFGAAITIVLNSILIPVLGYVGSAWATLICYVSMTILSYYIGQKYFPIPYQVGKILLYLLLSVGLFISTKFLITNNDTINLVVNNFIVLFFIAFVYFNERKNFKLNTNED
ncbi:MAG: oligosaccharide flippase family protein [Bacteroidota bacterium]